MQTCDVFRLPSEGLPHRQNQMRSVSAQVAVSLSPKPPLPARTLDVLIPGPLSSIRYALSTCAIEGNQLAIDALETIRRVEAGEPIGKRYADALNGYLTKYHAAECP